MEKRMATSKPDTENRLQGWLSGFIRLHILHHAAKEPLVGHWMIEELRRHGYRLSPGTLYPMLRGMEGKGYLRSRERRSDRRFWREYRATAAGRKALAAAKAKLRELFHELIDE
jgi:PadR family transcriptional regulator, regulatory protein PadR